MHLLGHEDHCIVYVPVVMVIIRQIIYMDYKLYVNKSNYEIAYTISVTLVTSLRPSMHSYRGYYIILGRSLFHYKNINIH